MQPLPFDPKDIPNLWNALEQLQDFVTGVHGSLADPKKKQMLGEVLEKLKTARADAEAIVPPYVEGLKKGAEKKQVALQKLQQQFETLQADIEAQMQAEKEKTSAPPQAVPTKKFELISGAELRRELLESAGINQKPAAAAEADGSGSVAQHWTETDQSQSQEEAPAPPPPSPAGKTERPVLKPKSSRPLSQPPAAPKPETTQPRQDDSLGKMSFDDEDE